MMMHSIREEYEATSNWENKKEKDEDEEDNMINKKVDPVEVDKLLVKELNQLSLENREKVMEEIHGIVSTSHHHHGNTSNNRDNNKSMIEEENMLLEQMQSELDNHASANASSAYQKAKLLQSEWIRDRNFLWSFLVKEEMDPKKAALRMIRYLDYVTEIYNTEEVLFRPIYLSDLNQESKQIMESEGSIQISPVRDPSGRRILAHLRDIGSVSMISRVRFDISVIGVLIIYLF